MAAMTLQLIVPVDDPAPGRTARRAMAAAVTGWHISDDVVDSVAVVVTELVTNALMHGRSDAQVTVTRCPTYVRIEISDEDSRLPVVAASDLASLGGLLLVAGLATMWGAERTSTGKTVWAELNCPAAPRPCGRRRSRRLAGR